MARIKQKALLPSLREKKRYVAYKIICEGSCSFRDLKNAVLDGFKDMFGLDGLSRAGLEFIDLKDGIGIIRVSSKGLDNLRAVFCIIRKVNKHDVVLRSLGVSGMLKKARLYGGASW